MKRAIVTVGLGWGDETKGACIDHLVRNAHLFGSTSPLVVRYSGGSQCGHNVQVGDKRHTFSQFGSGALVGVPTYLGPQVIISIPEMRREFAHLRELCSVGFNDLLIDKSCLVSTDLHKSINRTKEIARGTRRHGSCGHGIGETREYWLKYGNDAIFAADLKNRRVLCDKLELMKQRLLQTLATMSDYDNDVAFNQGLEFTKFMNIDVVAVADKLYKDSGLLYVVDHIPDCDVAFFEGAQGVLLDEWYGFHPHTTWSTVTPHYAIEMLNSVGCSNYSVLGITRTYTTRHGHGPFPSFDFELTQSLPDPGNPINQWQGAFKCGFLDFSLLRYAIKACGRIDGIVLSCVDQTPNMVCDGYNSTSSVFPHALFSQNIVPNYGLSDDLSRKLRSVHPVLQPTDIGDIRRRLTELAPIAIEGSGPTALDRKIVGEIL